MTDTEILLEFYKIQEYDRLQHESRKNYEYHCSECDYVGDPISDNICPECGVEMMHPLEDADQTTFTDDDQISSLKSLDIELSQKDEEMIRKSS